MQRYVQYSIVGLSLVSLLLILLQPSVTYAETNSIGYGETVQGEVTNYAGEEWKFSGCAGDVVTIAMHSDGFDAHLELYAPTGRQSRIDSNDSGTATDALIEEYILPTSGVYTIIAAGNRRDDRGAYNLSLNLAGSEGRLGDVSIGYAESVTGEVTTQAGDEWYFRGCASDNVTITAKSEKFEAYLALYDPTSHNSLAEGSASANNVAATIEVPSLSTSGIYTIVVTGNKRSDRGTYILSLQQNSTSVLTPTVTVVPTIAPTPTLITSTLDPQCTVVANTLNLRAGPGTVYNPPILSLSRSIQLTPLSRNSDAKWIKVRVKDASKDGWVSAGNEYISCNINVAELPLDLDILPPPPPSNSLTVADFNSCASTNNLNGAMGVAYEAPDQMRESYTEETGRGCVARLEYNIKGWAAFWMKLQKVDLTQYKRLTFDIRADQQLGIPRQVKIELKRSNNQELSIIYVSRITSEWQTVSVNLSDFGPTNYLPALSSLSAMEELVFTFEAESAGNAGVVYLDDIVFQP